MSILVRNIAFVLAMGCAVTSLITLLLYKRSDVRWITFIVAGPMTILRPSRYLRADRSKIPSAFCALGMALIAVVWVTSWIVDNP